MPTCTSAIASLPAIMGSIHESSNLGVTLIQRHRNDPDNEIYQQAYTAAFEVANAFVTNYDKIDSVILVGRDGVVLVSTTEKALYAEGKNVSDEIYFSEGIAGTYIGDMMLNSEDESKLDLQVSHPILDANKQTIGVVLIEYNTGELQEMMTDFTGQWGNTGETYLINRDRLMITPSRFNPTNSLLKQRVDTEGAQKGLAGTNGSGEYEDYRGLPIVGAWHYLGDKEWVLLAESDRAETYAPVYELRNLILTLGVGTGVVIAGIAYFITRTIAGPIISVTQTATKIADGALHERTNVRTKNEIGLLATAFNNMTDNLQKKVESERQSRTYLENTVNEYMGFVSGVAEGDLTRRLQLNGTGKADDATEDELQQLGTNLNMMVENLSAMAQQIRSAAAEVSAATTEIQAATTQQTASAAEQDSTVTETVATVEEMRQTVLQTSERAQSVANAAQESLAVSVTGQSAVTDTVDGMNLIRLRVKSIAENILLGQCQL